MTTELPTGNTYDKYASSNPIERRLMANFFDALDDALPATASRILEVGIGEGEIMERLRERYPEAVITGIDLPDPELQAQWSERSVAAFVGDATSLPFPDNTFDLCLAVEVLEHVGNPMQALREIQRVGTGHVVISVPREPLWRVLNLVRGSYIKDLGNTPGHINHWSKRRFRDFAGSRLNVTSVASPIPWTVVAAEVSSQAVTD